MLLLCDRFGACVIGNSCRAGRPSSRHLYLHRPIRQPGRRDPPPSTRRNHDSLPSSHPVQPTALNVPSSKRDQELHCHRFPVLSQAAHVIDRQSCSLCCNHYCSHSHHPTLQQKPAFTRLEIDPASRWKCANALRVGRRGPAKEYRYNRKCERARFDSGQRCALILSKVVVAVSGCLCCDQGRESDRARSPRLESLSSVEKEVHERPGCRRRVANPLVTTAAHAERGGQTRRTDLSSFLLR